MFGALAYLLVVVVSFIRIKSTLFISYSSINITTTGIAEIGLPPKKAGVYETDVADCMVFMRAFKSHVVHVLSSSNSITVTYEDKVWRFSICMY